jgi:very-short-patch-repair endonuclease
MPKRYSIDLANPETMTAVEIDGPSHNSPKRRDSDRRKDSALRALGWSVLRFSNQEVMHSLLTVVEQVRSNSST